MVKDNKKSQFFMSKLFDISTIEEILYKKNSLTLKKIINSLPEFTQEAYTLNDFYKNVYEKGLKKSYRCEFFIKNELLLTLNEEILKGRHPEGAVAMHELIIGKAKLDYLVINGETTAYEIKTELDTFNRLDHQLREYIGVFRKIIVCVDSLKTARKLEIFLNQEPLFQSIGILILGKKRNFRVSKKYSYKSLNKEKIFSTLNSSEVLNYFKDSDYPKVKNSFLSLSNKECHEIMKELLKKRGVPSQKFLKEYSKNLEHPLLAYLIKRKKIQLKNKFIYLSNSKEYFNSYLSSF